MLEFQDVPIHYKTNVHFIYTFIFNSKRENRNFVVDISFCENLKITFYTFILFTDMMNMFDQKMYFFYQFRNIDQITFFSNKMV